MPRRISYCFSSASPLHLRGQPARTTGQQFSWYNSGSGNCTVSNVGTWCDASSYGAITGGQSMPATAKTSTLTGTYSFTSPCNEGIAVVHVVGGHPEPEKRKK